MAEDLTVPEVGNLSGTLSWWPQPPNQHLQTWLLSCFCSLNCLLESSIEMICSHRKFSYSIHSKINISVVLTHTTILSMEAISFAFQSQIPNEFCWSNFYPIFSHSVPSAGSQCLALTSFSLWSTVCTVSLPAGVPQPPSLLSNLLNMLLPG